MRRFLALACAVAFVLPAVASSAQDKGVQFVETHLQMSSRAPAFHGKVKADNPVCISHRTILLYKEEAPGPPALLGKDHSTGRGAWKVKVSHLASGNYYAKAKPSTPSHHILCREDQSPHVVVD